MVKTILIAIPCLKVGGTEIQTLRLVEALVSGGYKVVTACYYEYDIQMVQQFRTAGSIVECFSAYSTRVTGTLHQYRFIRDGLKRVVREYHPQIAHVQYMAPGALPILALRSLGIKTILATAHTMADQYQNLRLVHWVQKHWVRVFTCITKTAENSFFGSSNLYHEDIPLSSHNHYTIYNTLTPKYSIIDKEPRTEKPTIGVVSRLVEIKGMDLVMPAFAQLKQQIPACRLLIVGDGPLRESMQQQQYQFGLTDADVEWKGLQPYSLLPKYYQQMDLLWIPSRSEGFGLTAIEAMANGCVVVAAQVGGLPEIMKIAYDNHFTADLLFQSDSSDDLANKTMQLLNEPSKLAGIQFNPNVQIFTFEQYKKLILDLYSKL